MKKILSIIIVFLPWRLKRIVLVKFWKYDIHKTARIGISYFFPKKLIMKKGSRIGHLNVAIHLDKVLICENSSIARLNWITGFPTNDNRHFKHQERESILVLGKESAITKNHHIDCTNSVIIGSYTTVAGYHSQILTHSIDISMSRQDSKPVIIGDYCFIGTNCIIIGGSELPKYSVLGAKSLLNIKHDKKFMLYGGVPAKPIKELSIDYKYFSREKGFVN